MSLRYPRRKLHVRLSGTARSRVRSLRRLGLRQRSIGAIFCVSQPTVSNIVRRAPW